MEKEWKNGGVSGVEESTEYRRDWTYLLHQFITITWTIVEREQSDLIDSTTVRGHATPA